MFSTKSFMFNASALAFIYTLSLHDALPISPGSRSPCRSCPGRSAFHWARSEEYTSELQSRPHLVCRLLLEKKNRVCSRPSLLCLMHRRSPLSTLFPYTTLFRSRLVVDHLAVLVQEDRPSIG